MDKYLSDTEKIRFEEDSKIANAQTRNILNKINAFIFIFDVDNLKPLWINKYFYTKMGYTNKDLRTLNKEDFLALFHPKSLPVFLNRIKHLLKNTKDDVKTVYQLKTKNNDWIYMLISSRVFEKNEDGSIKYLIGYASEVNSSELKHHLKEMTRLKRKCDNLSLINNLSRREFDIIRLISHGFTDKEISSRLNISIHTTKTHRKRIIQKLEVKNTAELVKFAVENEIC